MYDLFKYKLLFNQEKNPYILPLNWGILLPVYFYLLLFFLRRSIQPKNGHDHRTLLTECDREPPKKQ